MNVTIAPTRPSTGTVNPDVLSFFMVFNLLVCGVVLGLFGICGNIANIRVFVKQGFHDSVNITLAALAVGDIGALVTLQATNIMTNPWFLGADLPFSPLDVVRLISFYPHSYFIRVCGFVTAFAAFERCLCVVAPLRVKGIITVRVAVVVNVLIFTITLFNVFPPYYFAYFDWTFSPRANRSILAVAFRQDADVAFSMSYFITDLAVPYITFVALISCTLVIIIKVKAKAAWRKSVSSSRLSSGGKVSNKETRLVQMLTAVSLIFIVCLIPQSSILTAVAINQDLSASGEHFDIALLCYCIAFLMETVNSSVNIIVYYKMSSRYRETFINLLKGSI
ncbi:unnamed protein product [Lymnaea stagnalis]|uniref:G-protein coupled receptors family 1 profile domain-containing protein n=1 Tax=Lymnaea stagnalis TaxID=6523 RepID=A0AAV2HWA4_LYMST